MMMEASFDTEESFDDPSCLAPQPPGSVSPAKRQIKEVKETKITVSNQNFNPPLLLCLTVFCLYLHLHPLTVCEAQHKFKFHLFLSVDMVCNARSSWSDMDLHASWKPH